MVILTWNLYIESKSMSLKLGNGPQNNNHLFRVFTILII